MKHNDLLAILRVKKALSTLRILHNRMSFGKKKTNLKIVLHDVCDSKDLSSLKKMPSKI